MSKSGACRCLVPILFRFSLKKSFSQTVRKEEENEAAKNQRSRYGVPSVLSQESRHDPTWLLSARRETDEPFILEPVAVSALLIHGNFDEILRETTKDQLIKPKLKYF